MPSEDDGLVSVETIANILKLTPRRVQQLSSQGVIPKAKRGRYKIITSVWGYIDYLKKKLSDGGFQCIYTCPARWKNGKRPEPHIESNNVGPGFGCPSSMNVLRRGR